MVTECSCVQASIVQATLPTLATSTWPHLSYFLPYLAVQFSSDKYSGATVIAAGVLTYNGTVLLPNSDTLLITAASKALRGVEGTIEFNGNVADTRSVSFDFTWKGSDSRKDY